MTAMAIQWGPDSDSSAQDALKPTVRIWAVGPLVVRGGDIRKVAPCGRSSVHDLPGIAVVPSAGVEEPPSAETQSGQVPVDGAAVDRESELDEFVGDAVGGPLVLASPGLDLLDDSGWRRDGLTHFEAHVREMPFSADAWAIGRGLHRSTTRRRPSLLNGALA